MIDIQSYGGFAMKLNENGILKMSKKEELDGKNQRNGLHNGMNVYHEAIKRKSLGLK